MRYACATHALDAHQRYCCNSVCRPQPATIVTSLWPQVLLLLGVLVRHLQRFSLRTCHAWAQVPAESVLVCVSNNLLQVGAAEGLSSPHPQPQP